MNNLHAQFQNNVNTQANNLMTQMLCAEKGIDYNQLMQMAQQQHLQGIMQQEQMRAMEKAVARHYQGGQPTGLIGKLKEAFAPEQSSGFLSAMPMNQMMGMGVPAPQQGMNPLQLGNILAQQQQFIPQPAVQQAPPAPQPDPRLDSLAKDVQDLKTALQGIVSAFVPPHP